MPGVCPRSSEEDEVCANDQRPAGAEQDADEPLGTQASDQ